MDRAETTKLHIMKNYSYQAPCHPENHCLHTDLTLIHIFLVSENRITVLLCVETEFN